MLEGIRRLEHQVVSVPFGNDLEAGGKAAGEAAGQAYVKDKYHQPADQWDPNWDLSGMVQDAQLELTVGLRIADAPSMPRWTPGDEFEAARKSAAR